MEDELEPKPVFTFTPPGPCNALCTSVAQSRTRCPHGPASRKGSGSSKDLPKSSRLESHDSPLPPPRVGGLNRSSPLGCFYLGSPVASPACCSILRCLRAGLFSFTLPDSVSSASESSASKRSSYRSLEHETQSCAFPSPVTQISAGETDHGKPPRRVGLSRRYCVNNFSIQFLSFKILLWVCFV